MSNMMPSAIVPIRTKPWDYETKNEYEEVTLRLQPYLHGHYRSIYDERDYDVYDPRYTRIKSSDWEAYRDPEKLWYSTYIVSRRQLADEVAHALQFAQQQNFVSFLRPEWVSFLKDVYLPLRHAEYGMSMQLQHVIRYAMGTPIEQSVTFEACDKQGRAQWMTQWAMALEEYHGAMLPHAKQMWLEHPGFASLLQYIEQLWITDDWMEVLCAINLCLDPLFMRLLYDKLSALALQQGDSLLAMIHHSCMKQVQWQEKYTTQLFSLVVQDQAESRWDYLKALGYADWKGDYRWGKILSDPRLTPEEPLTNAEIVQEWVNQWYPRAYRAVAQLELVISQHAMPFSIRQQLAELEEQTVQPLFQKLGLNIPAVQGGVKQ